MNREFTIEHIDVYIFRIYFFFKITNKTNLWLTFNWPQCFTKCKRKYIVYIYILYTLQTLRFEKLDFKVSRPLIFVLFLDQQSTKHLLKALKV